MRSPNIRYLPAIDHLRACAALLIVLYHGLHLFSYQARFQASFGIDHWLQPGNVLLAALAEGHTAVALFMVLSGFILTLGSLDDAVEYRPFIRNRLLRTYPLFLLLNSHPSLGMLIFVQVCLMAILGLFQGSYCAFVCELFPSHVRSTGMAIGYNFAVMLFGGFAGAIATLLIKVTGNNFAAVFYGLLGSIIGFLTVLCLKDRSRQPLL